MNETCLRLQSDGILHYHISVAVCYILLQAFSTSALEPQHASQDITPEQPLHTDYLGGEQRAIPNVDQPSGKSADDGFRLGIFSIVDDKPEVAVREAMERLLQQTQVSDSAAPNMETLQLPNKLGGTACLAWLPDGQMIGKKALDLPNTPPFCKMYMLN